MAKRRFNVELSENLDQLIDKIAQHDSVSKSDVVRRSVSGYALLKDYVNGGSTLIIRDPSGVEREVILS